MNARRMACTAFVVAGLVVVAASCLLNGCAVVTQSHVEDGVTYRATGIAFVKGDIADLKTGFEQTKLDDGSSETAINQESAGITTEVSVLLAEVIKLLLTSGLPVP